MFSHDVGFTCPIDVPGVAPPFEKGRRESVYVITRTDSEPKIKEAAKRKLAGCYGIVVSTQELTVYAGFEY